MPLRGDKAARKHTERPKRDTKNKKTAKERRGGSKCPWPKVSFGMKSKEA
jgi:hypothetical protein